MPSEEPSTESGYYNPEHYVTEYKEHPLASDVKCILPLTNTVFELKEDPDNPIVGAFMGGDDNKRPEYVIAIVRKHHLDKGQDTRYNPTLTKEIHNRGIVKGDEIEELGIKPDQCGHIIAYSLGGHMEYCNLIPQGQTSNIRQYHNAEKIIKRHVTSTKKKNPWALIQVRLIYENTEYPNRPTKFYYSYFLYKDEDEEENKENSEKTGSKLIPLLPCGIKISVKGVAEKARTRVAPNRVARQISTSNSRIWGAIAAGLQLAASLLSVFGPTNIATPPAPAPEPVPVPVPEPVPLPVPAPPPPVVVPPPFPVTVYSQPMQLCVNPLNFAQPLVLVPA